MDDEKIRLYEESQQLIVKSNDLILKTHYNLTLIEMKLVSYLISKIVAEDKEIKTVQISIKDFCKLTNIEPKGRNYEQIRNSIKSLRNKSWWISLDENNETQLLYSWLDYAIIQKNTGIIEICLSKSLTPFLIQLRSRYTKYRLAEILKLKSKASIRLFEICQSQLYRSEFIIEIDLLKKLLDISGKYEDYRDLRKRILEPSVREINDLTCLNIEYEPIKNGKKIVKLRFKVNEAMGYQLSLLD